MNQKLTEEERAAIREWIGGRPIEDLVHALKGDIEHLQEGHARARRRISELEAQVTASETVSKAEYSAMVKQRDDIRAERNMVVAQRDAERQRVDELRGALESIRAHLKAPSWNERTGKMLDEIDFALGVSEEEPQ
jgi:predicted  nucleic acid-binding Zn-ribbon protein